MKNKLIFETNCIFLTKLRVYKNMVEIRKYFGLSVRTVPIKNISAVDKSILGNITIRTSGGEDFEACPWSVKNRTGLYKVLTKEISK